MKPSAVKSRRRPTRSRPGVDSLETREVLSASPLVQADILILQADQNTAHANIQQDIAVVKADIAAIQSQTNAAMSTVKANIKNDQLTLLQDQNPSTFPNGDPTAVAADKAAIKAEQNNLNSLKSLEKQTLSVENSYVHQLQNLSKQYDGTVKFNIASVKHTSPTPSTDTVSGISAGVLADYTNRATNITNSEASTYSFFTTNVANLTM